MAITTTSQATAPVNAIYQQTLLRQARPRCPYFVGSMGASVMRHSGTFRVTWRRIDALTPTTTALSEITGNLSLPTRTATQLSVTDVSATIQKYGDFVHLTEEMKLINLSNFDTQTDGVIATLGIQAGRSLNRLQRNALEDNATLVYPGSASTDSAVADPVDMTMVRNVTNVLDRNSATMFTPQTTGSTNVNTSPVSAAFWGLCHSDVKQDIRLLPGFVPVEKYAGQTQLANGEFGWVQDVRWVSSPEATIDTDTGGAPGNTVRSTSGTLADLYTSLIFGRDAHGSVSLDSTLIKEIYDAGDEVPGVMVINKPLGSAGAGDPLDEIATLGWKTWHAGVILNSTWIRGLRTAATKLQ